MFSSTARASLKRGPTRVLHNASVSSVTLTCPRRRYTAVAFQDPSEESSPPLTNLRSNPYTFTPDTSFQQTQNGTAVARYNQKLFMQFSRRNSVGCFVTAAEMKREGITPNTETYNILLGVACANATSLDCFAIHADMLSVGVQPNLETYNIMLKSCYDSRQFWFVMEEMKKRDIAPSNETYQTLITYFLNEKNLEMPIRYLQEMRNAGIAPTLDTILSVVETFAKLGYSRFALELAQDFETSSPRLLGNQVWMSCLASAAESLWGPGTEECWDIVVSRLNLPVSEGVCLAVLRTAARNALPELATKAITEISNSKLPIKEYHFIPLIKALADGNGLKTAIQALPFVRSYGIEPTMSTVKPIFDVLKEDVDVLDSVWTHLDEMHSAGQAIETAAMNAVVQAAVFLGDLQRAMGAYKSFGDYNIVPNRDTFRFLLDGAIGAAHRDLGDLLLQSMVDLNIEPDATTFEQMIKLHLTQDIYDDAFDYLERIKAAQVVPPGSVYEAIAIKCAMHEDSRYQMLVSEMRELGHPVTRSFMATLTRYSQSAQRGSAEFAGEEEDARARPLDYP